MELLSSVTWVCKMVTNTQARYDRYCKELEELNRKVRRKLRQIEEAENKLQGK